MVANRRSRGSVMVAATMPAASFHASRALKAQAGCGCRCGVAPAARKARKVTAWSRLENLRPVRIQDQAVMGIGRFGQGQQRLQQPLDMGGGQQILAPRHQGHALKSIVHHHRQMIGGRHVLARQHQIAEQQRIDGDGLRHVRGTTAARRAAPPWPHPAAAHRRRPRRCAPRVRPADRWRQVPG